MNAVARHRHGLVLGKFYPPHAGHRYLIDTAAAACARLTVVCAPSTVESIPLADRLAWLREIHAGQPHVRVVGGYDDDPIDYHDDAVWAAHVEFTRTLVAKAAADDGMPARIDAVFSSESYGPELARRFDARHVPVDPDRRAVPVSGTAVRADPAAHWSLLAAPVRAGLARRVVVVGAESTGTTTLARALAHRYRRRGGVWARTRWVPEYGRERTEEKLAVLRAADPAASVFDVTWQRDDFVEVARRQNEREDTAARDTSPLLVCDTDAFATAVWEQRYLGTASAAVTAQARRPDLYLLTDHVGVPFVDDGLRDGEQLRLWMTDRFREVLAAQPAPVVELTGPLPARLEAATAACDAVLTWRFADPLG
ncbi:AAA family ATPase [Actinocatenispora sera]|uniref:AAA family ATPase n=1 Tax=Actinocatenispora sera TaxID=390989 RepID=UPI0033F60187